MRTVLIEKRSKHWKDLKLTRPELQRSNCDKICEIPNMKIHSGNTNLEHFSIHSPPSLQVSLYQIPPLKHLCKNCKAFESCIFPKTSTIFLYLSGSHRNQNQICYNIFFVENETQTQMKFADCAAL